MLLLITDIDGVCALFPEEAKRLKIDHLEKCFNCKDMTKDQVCTRPSFCPNIGQSMQDQIDKIFSPSNVSQFKPNEKVRDLVNNIRWSPTCDGMKNQVLYISGRPSFLMGATLGWLARNRFPAGPLALLGDMPDDPAENKVNFLGRILKNAENEIDFLLVLEDDKKTVSLYQERFGAIDLFGMIK